MLQARTDSNFKIPSTTVQTFSNVVLNSAESVEISSVAKDLPTHTSTVTCKDGYKPEAMLFVDENFSQSQLQRDTSLSALSFKPVVKFNSSHYKYVTDDDGSPRILQIGVAVDEELQDLGFRVPPSDSANPEAAKCPVNLA